MKKLSLILLVFLLGCAPLPQAKATLSITTYPSGDYAHIVVKTSGVLHCAGTCNVQGFDVEAANVTIDGFDIDQTPANGFNGAGIFVNAPNCVIKNNYVTRGNIAGIKTTALASGCIITNNKLFHNLRAGLYLLGGNADVESNEIWGTVQFADWTAGKNPPSGFQPDADGIVFFGSGSVFRGNYIHNIPSSNPDGTATNSHSDCFQTWGQIPASGITIDGNICDNVQPQSINLDNLGSGFTFEHNSGVITVTNNTIAADVCFFEHDTVDVTFSHNSCIYPAPPKYANISALNAYPVGISIGVNSTGGTFDKNLFSGIRGYDFLSKSGGVVDKTFCVLPGDCAGFGANAFEVPTFTPTFTNTAISTPTPTQTTKPSETPTFTPTKSQTPTYTPSIVPSATPSNTPTSTPTSIWTCWLYNGSTLCAAKGIETP